jgi:LacI family purine nucleotide synthesis repressor
MVTIKDVAREAGVAISTVSNVFNNADIVSEETKQKVLNAVEKLHYIPNMNAKLLKSNRKNTIGLFLTSLQGDFYRVLTQAIHLQCKLNNYLLNIYISNDNSPDEIYRMIIASGVAGAIIYHEDLTGDYVKRIATVNIPMVFIDRESKGKNISGVLVDDKLGASMAVDHLIKLGHKRIGYMHGNQTGDDNHRYQGYVEMMEKNNLPIDENIILRGYYEESLAYSEMRSALSSGVDIPDAWGCIQALQDVGIKVPEDVSVIGYDDSSLSKYYGVPLTTVHSPITEMGSASANELFRLLSDEGDKSGTVTKLSPKMIYRSSCGKRK